jgi:hypothetical protein
MIAATATPPPCLLSWRFFVVLQDTKLAVSQQQEREWVERQQAAAGGQAEPYHFVCEVFFMTLQVR